MLWSKKELTILYHKKGKTLQEIGDIKGVTRECVRQHMEFYQIPRSKNRPHKYPQSHYKSIEDYLLHSHAKQPNWFLHKYISKKPPCSECGSSQHLHFHHINYPAYSLSDIQVLCASCHKLKHSNKMTFIKQLDLFNDYKIGLTYKQLSYKYSCSVSLVALVIRKIKNGYHTLRG